MRDASKHQAALLTCCNEIANATSNKTTNKGCCENNFKEKILEQKCATAHGIAQAYTRQLRVNSSVARGEEARGEGYIPLPIGMQNKQNTTFSVLFEANFCAKSENSPPSASMMRNGLLKQRIWSEFILKNVFWATVKTFFFFGLYLILGRKSIPISTILFLKFFWSSPYLPHDNLFFWIKFFLVRFVRLKQPPPIVNLWLRACE